jgi:hypothetical protein
MDFSSPETSGKHIFYCGITANARYNPPGPSEAVAKGMFNPKVTIGKKVAQSYSLEFMPLFGAAVHFFLNCDLSF